MELAGIVGGGPGSAAGERRWNDLSDACGACISGFPGSRLISDMTTGHIAIHKCALYLLGEGPLEQAGGRRGYVSEAHGCLIPLKDTELQGARLASSTDLARLYVAPLAEARPGMSSRRTGYCVL